MSTPSLPHRSISVIIPAYNAAPFVSRAIDSILAQTYAVREVLVVDDGSLDDTSKVVSRYPAPVRLLRQANGGPASARNHGAREARGEWLALLDADDTWLPTKIERQIGYMKNPRVGVIHCREGLSSDVNFDTLWQRNCIANSTVLIRRTAFEQVDGFDEDRGLISVEDYNLWLRLAAAGWEIATCPEDLWKYTPAPGNLSSQSERFAHAELLNAQKIAALLVMEAKVVKKKQIAIYETYGRELLHSRKMLPALRFFIAAMWQQPSLRRLTWCLAACLPPSVLDLRRLRNLHAFES